MQIEWFFLLALIGSASGSINALIRIAPALIALPVFYFFLPLFNVSFDEVVLPVVATCLVAFMPTHLYAWIRSMKNGSVDFQCLINFAPGMAMGGIIGAQLLSLVSFLVFNVFFTLLAVITVLHIVATLRNVGSVSISFNKLSHIPLGLGVGALSLLGGTCGRVMGEVIAVANKTEAHFKEGTIQGFTVFVSIAAMVGFIYPAQDFDHFGVSGFIGAMHLPSLIVLALSYWFAYWFCKNKGNELDRIVLYMSFIVFLVCSLFRMWL